jgi:hypothetical protein
MFQIPELRDSFLTGFEAEFWIEQEEIARRASENDSADWEEAFGNNLNKIHTMVGDHHVLVQSYYEGPSSPARVKITTADWGEEVDFPFVPADILRRHLGVLTGLLASTTIDVYFHLRTSSIPAEGLVRDLAGVRTSVGDDELVITGAELVIRGFPSDSLSWSVSKSDSWVYGKFSRSSQCKVTDQILDDAVHSAKSRVNHFILAEQRISHGAT